MPKEKLSLDTTKSSFFGQVLFASSNFRFKERTPTSADLHDLSGRLGIVQKHGVTVNHSVRKCCGSVTAVRVVFVSCELGAVCVGSLLFFCQVSDGFCQKCDALKPGGYASL